MIEDDELRAIFLSDFNEPEEGAPRVTPNLGPAFEIPYSIFDLKPTQETIAAAKGVISGAHPTLRCLSSQFPLSLMGQCTVRIRGQDYGAFDVKPDGTGFTWVELKRK
jgi:hypothetical protein